MKSSISFKDKCFLITMRDFVEALDGDAKLELTHYLSCDDVIIKNVADQILTGCTEDGSYGASNCMTDKPSTPLSIAQRRVSKESSETAKHEIKRLEHALEFANGTADDYRKKYFKLYHAWPEGYRKPSEK